MRYFLVFIFLIQFVLIKAQHTVDFTIPTPACIGEFLQIQNTSDPGVSVRWDFCSDQLMGTYSSLTRPVIVGSMTDIAIVEDNGLWYGFVTSRNGSLSRLNFGNNPNNDYTITVLTVITTPPGPSLLINPESISVVKEGNQWYGLVTLLTNHEIIRLSWGQNLLSNPTAESLNLASTNKLKNPIQIDVAYDGSNYTAVVVNSNTSNVSLINFGSSITNNPLNADIINSPTFPGAADMQGVSISRQCDQWYLYAIATNRIYKVNVGSNLFSTITSGQIVDFTADVPITIGAFNKIKTVDYGGSTYAYFASYTGNYLAAVKWVEGEPSPEFMSLNSTSVPGNPFSLEIFQYNNNFGLYVGGFGGGVSKVSITKNCYSGTRFTQEISPENITYSQAGTFSISLTMAYGDGTTCALTKDITITGNTAPLPAIINSSNICVSNPVAFDVDILNGIPVSGWSWNFHPGASGVENPDHTFAAAGVYTVDLEVTSPNGCSNTVSKTLKMYDAPVADFSLPAAPLICTNGETVFTNNTTDNFDGNLSYQWYVAGDPVSTARDLQHTFLSTGAKAIKLETSIPGCTSDETETTTPIQSGPVVDFSFSGLCDGDNIQFTNNITEPVTSYDWDFDDDTDSAQPNPAHLFPSAGTYLVSLTAQSPLGCDNVKTKLVTIRARPSVNFEVGIPPFTCSSAQTPFTNLTPDSDIASWQWNFDDPGADNLSSAREPIHTFASANTYNVKLTATTGYGCSRTIQKPIIIAQSPVATITHTLACNNVPVNFTAPGTNIQSYYWEMGTSYYEVANPVHTFATPGNHGVKLKVKSVNQCEITYNKSVFVPVPLTPDFSVTRNCAGDNAVFTDLTAGTDAVASQAWDFGGLGSATGSPASFKFNATGNRAIRLSVTGQSGCSYITTKTISVISPPVAGFTATPETGALPLDVQFTNTSTGATRYAWAFGDGATSALASPAYTFQNTGDFVSVLTASNNEGCESSISKTISIVAPLPDVDLKVITVSENTDGSLKVIITIQNKGNTILRDLPVYIDISGNVSLREIVKEPIAPSSLYNLVLDYGLAPTANVSFLCATAALQNDLAPEGNRICTELNNKTSFIAPYPNPVKDILHIEWVAAEKRSVSIRLIDAFGKKMMDSSILSVTGLNHYLFDASGLQSGIYLLIMDDGTAVRTERIFISAEN